MIIAGTSFCIGAVFQASAKSTIALLFIGRVFWGIGKQSCSLTVCTIEHALKSLHIRRHTGLMMLTAVSILSFTCQAHLKNVKDVKPALGT